jgi:esterase/lipase
MTVGWDEALARVAELQGRDGHDVVPVCGTQFLSHGSRSDESVLLLHGYTNAPVQFREIAAAYSDAGANVLVPRVPFHGLADPFNHELTNLTPQVLATFTDEAVAAAEGLGERLTVVGLSLGGLLTAYAARHFDSVRTAIMIAPFMQPKSVPEWIDAPFDAAVRALPDAYNWWNPKRHEAEVRGTYAYPKFSLKAVAAMIDLRRRLERDPARRTNHAELVRLVVNDHDIAVRNDIARSVTRELFTDLAEEVDVAVLETSLGLAHDVVEPNGENHDRMDTAREHLWPLLGLEAPAPGSLPATPIPGGGYFAEPDGQAVGRAQQG